MLWFGRMAAWTRVEDDVIRPRDLAVSTFLAALGGIALWHLWWWAGYPVGTFVRGLAGHGPDPLAWPRFVSIWIPVAHLLFACGHYWLSRVPPRLPLRTHYRADQATLGLILALAAGLAILSGRGPWRTIIGTTYVVFIGAKTTIFVRALWHWLPSHLDRPRAVAAAVLLGSLLPYLSLDGYVATAISTAGDEPYYLLIAHSLLRDRDVNLAKHFSERDYAAFYWDTLATSESGGNLEATREGGLYSRAHTGLQPLLLLPGYAVAGRLGAMVTMTLVSAATLAVVFCLALRLGASPRATLLAWVGMAFSVPLLSFQGSPWPEMSAALFGTLATFLLLQDPPNLRQYAGVVACLIALITLKVRFVLMGIPIVAGFVRRVTWKAVLGLSGAATALLLATIVWDAVVSKGLFLRSSWAGGGRGTLAWAARAVVQPLLHYRGLFGFLLDQEHGVLLVAPVFFLAAVGAIVAASDGRTRALLLVALPFVTTWYALAGIAIHGVPVWFAGFNPPARYLVSTLPPLLTLIAFALDRVHGRLAWRLVFVLYALTFGYAAVTSIRPELRFQPQVGRAAAAVLFERLSGLDPGRLLPSYVAPGGAWVGPGVVLLVAPLVGGWLAVRRRGDAPTVGDVAVGGAAAGLLIVVLVGWVWWQPWGIWPAAAWQGQGGTRFQGVIPIDTGRGALPEERLVWAAQRNSLITVAPRLPAGRYRLILRAGAQARDAAPILTLKIGDGIIWRTPLDTTVPPAWRERDYVYDVPWRGGRLPVQLELTGIRGRPRTSLAYLAHLNIQRLAPE